VIMEQGSVGQRVPALLKALLSWCYQEGIIGQAIKLAWLRKSRRCWQPYRLSR
jgi:hypothetical protein